MNYAYASLIIPSILPFLFRHCAYCPKKMSENHQTLDGFHMLEDVLEFQVSVTDVQFVKAC